MSSEVKAGKDQLIINGEVCCMCDRPFSLADYDSRVHLSLGATAHADCWRADEAGEGPVA